LHLCRLQSDLVRNAGRWTDLIALDPTDEFAYQELMREALDHGGRAAAIRWYGQLRNALASELGVAPDETSEALYERCLEGLSHAPSLFGRAAEIAAVEAMLADGSRSGGSPRFRGNREVGAVP
jgi:DNA-binding SARP family transcriptional activator